MGSSHIIKQECSSFLYLPNKVLFRYRPIMHNIHCDILLALHVCTLESTLIRSPSPGACNHGHTKAMSDCVHIMVASNRKLGLLEKHIIRR